VRAAIVAEPEAQMKLSMDELKKEVPFRYISPETIEFQVAVLGGRELWTISKIDKGWRIKCDEPERFFLDEQEVYRYFWDRLHRLRREQPDIDTINAQIRKHWP
jgi:hypothetical protein